MRAYNDKIDVNSMPVHLFVKSPKQAKKINKKIDAVPAVDAYSYRRASRLKFALAS